MKGKQVRIDHEKAAEELVASSRRRELEVQLHDIRRFMPFTRSERWLAASLRRST